MVYFIKTNINNSEFSMNFPQAVKVLCAKSGITQTELADRMNAHRAKFSQMKSPSLSTIKSVAESLGVKPSELVAEAEKYQEKKRWTSRNPKQ